jgi:ABC-2 type transport system permease protein
MRAIVATFIKEFQILIRDKTGFAVLFVMPVMFVFIMTLVQHEAYKKLNDTGVPVLLVNRDVDTLGLTIEAEFNKMSICELTVDRGDKYKTMAEVQEAVLNEGYVMAVVIPAGATEVLRENVGQMIGVLLSDKNLKMDVLEQIGIEMVTDPVVSKSFVMAISSGLREFIASVKTKVLFGILASKMQETMGSQTKVDLPEDDFFVFHERSAAQSEDEGYQPNAVQHNVPAWAIFAMFFMVIPLSQSIIAERSEGLYVRTRTFPGSYLSILSGKLLLYFLVGVVQFGMILLIGIHLLPLLDLPVLHLGNHGVILWLLTAAVGLTAVGYGLMIGTLFDTAPQASIFGGISILLMSALGGIWIPVNILPPMMQTISSFFPLNWALTGYYELFIKGGGWASIQWQVVKLCAFFLFSLAMAYKLYQMKRKLV